MHGYPGKLFEKYTGKLCSVFTRILSKYGRIQCKKPVFTVVLCSAISDLDNVPVKALPFNEKGTLHLSEG